MSDDLPPLQFRHVTNLEKDRRTELSEPAPKSPGPWTGSLGVSEQRAQSMRAALVRNNASPELLADFDAEMAQKGHAQAPDAQENKLAREKYGVHLNVKPSDINPEWKATELTPEQVERAGPELRDFAVSLRLSPALSSSLLEYLSTWGPRLQQMSVSERENWSASEQKAILKLCNNDEAAVQTAKAQAKATLARVPGDFAKRLSTATLLDSAWVTMTLSYADRTAAAYSQLRRRKGG